MLRTATTRACTLAGSNPRTILFLLLTATLITACSDETIIIGKKCPQDAYCEDVSRIAETTAYYNITSIQDTSTADINTLYERLEA